MHRKEDQFRRLAALTGVMVMAAAEALAQDRTSSPGRRIVVSLPDRKLAVVEGSRVTKIYSTAVGAARTPSPSGEFSVVQRIPDPTWYTKGRVVPPGKSNPLGTRWLGLSVKGYGIHGTSNPRSIGRAASHGCIRMRNRDVEELFEIVAVGDPVTLIAARNEETERLFGTPAATVQTASAEPAIRNTSDVVADGQ